MDINFIKNYIGKLSSAELRDLMSYIDRETRGSEIVDSIKKVFDKGYILQLNLGNSSVYASKLIKSEYGVGNVRYFYFKLLNCGDVVVEIPNSIVDTFTKERPYIDFSSRGGCKLFVEKDSIEHSSNTISVDLLDNFKLSDLRVNSMLVARIITGEYNPFATTISLERSANMSPKAVADVDTLKKKVEALREKVETNVFIPNTVELEEGGPELKKICIDEEVKDLTFTNLSNIVRFVNSDNDISVFVEHISETNEENSMGAHKHIFRRKDITSELYPMMKLMIDEGEPVLHFEKSDYGFEHKYRIKLDNECQVDYIQIQKNGKIIVQLDKNSFLKLTLSKNSTPLTYKEVGDILYA